MSQAISWQPETIIETAPAVGPRLIERAPTKAQKIWRLKLTGLVEPLAILSGWIGFCGYLLYKYAGWMM
ncbi:MAG: hypothetical protein GKR89_36785 [Candidatus Latescibacteria bacterium]|nr:hypothetical protein [Candidatus Latescibacterota bacterium]